MAPLTSVRSEDRAWLAAEDGNASLRARLAASALAESLGFDETRTGAVVIAASEMAGNMSKHAREGVLVLRLLRCNDVAGVELLAMDRGPGIADVDAARTDGHSSTGTLGIGLGAIERLSDRFALHSVPGRGTVLAATFWPAGRGVGQARAAALLRPMVGETACGDAYAERCDDGRRSLLLVDALGHGPVAAMTADEAIRAFHEVEAGGPTALLEQMHRRLRHTRGLAAAVVQFEEHGPAIAFSGIGNVSVWIGDGQQRRGLPSQPGILGHVLRRLREVRDEVPEHEPIVLHTDGISDRWSFADYPGLVTQAPLVIAATLHRDAARVQDDAGIAVTRTAP